MVMASPKIMPTPGNLRNLAKHNAPAPRIIQQVAAAFGNGSPFFYADCDCEYFNTFGLRIRLTVPTLTASDKGSVPAIVEFLVDALGLPG
jgi:hypothetical protein